MVVFQTEQEEPYELRGSRTVTWERRGVTPLCDQTMPHGIKNDVEP